MTAKVELPEDVQDWIDDYEVHLEFNDNGCGGVMSHCFVMKGNFSASLEFLKAEGTLEDARGNTHVVPKRIQKDIEDWADDNGY